MSTRAAIHFEDSTGRLEAIIYRHSDGYPSGLGQDLTDFVAKVKELRDTRLTDPSYLAAKWVVFDVLRQQGEMQRFQQSQYASEGFVPSGASGHPLDFLSIGIVRSDPGDIEYRYHVRCDGQPTITYQHIGWNDEDAGTYALGEEEPAEDDDEA